MPAPTTLPFYTVNPSGNTTLLFDGLLDPKSTAYRSALAQYALNSTHLGAEQAGFIDCEQGILRMAGGEFCVNATRALGLIMAMRAHIEPGETWAGHIHTSGMEKALAIAVHCSGTQKNCYDVRLHLPFANLPLPENLDSGHDLIHLPGIKHLLIDNTKHTFVPAQWQKQAQNLRAHYGLEKDTAVGCIWWQKYTQAMHGVQYQKHTHLQAHPVVMVPTPHTECYENACGSGTLALALFLHAQKGIQNFCVHQPGGYLTVTICKDTLTHTVSVGGPVSLIASGEAYFPHDMCQPSAKTNEPFELI